MSRETGTREISTDDLANVRRVLEPLRHWLQRVHGQRALREGVLGMASVVIGLAGILMFDVSPLVALIHLILAMATDGFGARLAVHRSESNARQPFVSPLHALTFVEDVIAGFRAQPYGLGRPRIAAARVTEVPAATTGTRDTLPPARDGLIVFSLLMAMFAYPLAVASLSVFDRGDWLVLAALLVINTVQLWSIWRDSRGEKGEVPWDRDWSIEPPTFGRLMFWKHYRLVSLFTSFLVMMLLGTMLLHAQSDSGDRLEFATTLEARLRPLVVVLLTGSGALHLLLLAAPWQTRRILAAFDAFDMASFDRKPREP